MLDPKRREFIALFGGGRLLLAAKVKRAWGQQPKVPVIGYLGAGSAAASAPNVAVFRQSLAEAGYVVGRNAAIEYRFAEGQYDRLPAMAAELVRSEVASIQLYPKDLRALPGHPEPAVSWHSGFRGGAHARPKAA